MYPAHGLALFPPFPRNERVFVAMTFDPRFEQRWRSVIEPACQDVGLQGFRVDIPKASSSIPADILAGIAQSRLVLADLTPLDGYRNGNVMYEVGIAHACRQPEEVILLRSDEDRLLFDVSTIRVNRYDPERDPAGSRAAVAGILRWAMTEVDSAKSITVQHAANALDYPTTMMLARCFTSTDGLKVPQAGVFHAARSDMAISRLLELGLARTDWRATSPEERADKANLSATITNLARYRVTSFGTAVYKHILNRWVEPGAGKAPAKAAPPADPPRDA